MLIPTSELLKDARAGGYAVGAFNVYNLEGARAAVEAAEELKSPFILQILPTALEIGGSGLVALCKAIATEAKVPTAVHLDHCSDPVILRHALESGFSSIMADGSGLPFEKNVDFTRKQVVLARSFGAAVEGELGRLSGEEDGVAVAARHEQLTSPDQAAEFVERTGVDALAVCIGNIHGKYHTEPVLDFARLSAIADRVTVPLVLHGTSGLPDGSIQRAIEKGVCKFNVNTEIRSACIRGMANLFTTGRKVELVELMKEAVSAMKRPIKEKITLFCSANTTGK